MRTSTGPRSIWSASRGAQACFTSNFVVMSNSFTNQTLAQIALFVNGDKYENKTIDQIRGDLSAKTGENVVVRRFTRFAVGE